MSAAMPSTMHSGIAESVLDTIGHTPLIRLARFGKNLRPQLLAKVEFFNPAGSIKDRIGIAMVREAEAKGWLKPGGTIIEATAGNTGLGLALAAAVLGYRCIFVMPDKMSADKVNLLKSYGAEVVITPTAVPPDSPESYNGVANRLEREIKGAWRPNQFMNQSNPRVHYESTGPEIWEQTEGRVTHFVSGAGTGGTLSGIGMYLKEQNPNVRIIGADIEGSVLSGDSPKPWKVEGIGEDFVPSTLNAQVVDEWIRISDQESFTTARAVARTEGLLLGGSCGTTIAAAVKLAARLGPDDMIVAMAADTGRNYVSKFYNDAWMAQNGFSVEKPITETCLRDLIDARGQQEMIAVAPNETLQKAVELQARFGISQLPVIDKDGKVLGSIQEITIMKALHERKSVELLLAKDVMAKPLPMLDENVVLDEAYRLLMAGHPGVIVTRNDAAVGIVTRTDLVNYYGSRE